MTDRIMSRMAEMYRPISDNAADNRRRVDLDAELNMIWQTLTKEFDADSVGAAIGNAIQTYAEREWSGGVLDAQQCTKLRVGLLLAEVRPELALDAETTKQLVRKLNCIGWRKLLNPWVSRHLDLSDLVETLALGVRLAPAPFSRASCFEALRLYWPEIRHPHDASRLQASLEIMGKEVRRWVDATPAYLAETVETARDILWAIRRSEELPMANVFTYGGYRCDQDAAAYRYRIERIVDAELSIRVREFKLDGDVVTVEFQCVDSEVLPEDCPSIIEHTVLRAYMTNEGVRQIREVRCAHVGRKEQYVKKLSGPWRVEGQ